MSRLPAALAVASVLFLLTGPPTCSAQLPPELPEITDFQPICNASDFTDSSGPAIPPLPQQFSFHVEANILNKNRTTWVHEFFDEIGNRGRFNFFRDGIREHVIYDYNNNEIFIYPNLRDGSECSVFPLAQSRFINFTFGLTRVNGSIHIGTGRNFLEFLRDDTPVKFGGMSLVRGVPALRWDACINNGNISMLASYYYNTDDFSYPTIANSSASNMVLSQMVVRGVTLFNDSLSNFDHVYSIFGFQSGPAAVQDRFFQVPTGLACVGRIPGIPVPQAPRYFSTYAERIDSSMNLISSVREFYDSVHELFRVDFYLSGQFGGSAGPHQVIHDFGSEVYYTINQQTGNCTAGSLRQPNNLLQDVTLDEDGNPHLISPVRLFFLNSNFSYEGVTTVRGLEVDSWITIGDSYMLPGGGVELRDFVYEIFFTRPQYTHNTLLSSNSTSVPWAYNIRGTVIYPNISEPTNTSSRVFNVSGNLFDFSVDEPPYDAFDASLCFSAEDTHTVILTIEAPRVGIDFRAFRTNLRENLVQFLNVRPLQINNIHIPFDNGTHLFVAFHVTNISQFATPGDTETTADQAVDTLRAYNQSLPFTVDLGNGQSVAPVFLTRRRGRDTNFNNNTDTCDMTCPPPTTTMPSTTDPNCSNDNITGRLGLSDGIVAGITIGLFIVGFIAGLFAVLICFICCKCMKSKDMEVSSVKYKKHADEMESM